jgi:hypothetical protein
MLEIGKKYLDPHWGHDGEIVLIEITGYDEIKKCYNFCYLIASKHDSLVGYKSKIYYDNRLIQVTPLIEALL